MRLEITGTVFRESELVTGESKAGKAWTRATMFVETEGEEKYAIGGFGGKSDKIIDYNLEVGRNVSCEVELVSKEYQGRFFNNLNLIDFSVYGMNDGGEIDTSSSDDFDKFEEEVNMSEVKAGDLDPDSEDLPF